MHLYSIEVVNRIRLEAIGKDVHFLGRTIDHKQDPMEKRVGPWETGEKDDGNKGTYWT